jgi:hypothetical protein
MRGRSSTFRSTLLHISISNSPSTDYSQQLIPSPIIDWRLLRIRVVASTRSNLPRCSNQFSPRPNNRPQHVVVSQTNTSPCNCSLRRLHRPRHIHLQLLSKCASATTPETPLHVFSIGDTFRRQCLHDANDIASTSLQIHSRHKKRTVMESEFERVAKCGGRRGWTASRIQSTIWTSI